MKKELNDHWEVVSEAYQVILRSVGVKDGYELLKDFTRGKVTNKEAMHAFIDEVATKHALHAQVVQNSKK